MVNEKVKKRSIYKKWWFWFTLEIIFLIVALIIIYNFIGYITSTNFYTETYFKSYDYSQIYKLDKNKDDDRIKFKAKVEEVNSTSSYLSDFETYEIIFSFQGNEEQLIKTGSTYIVSEDTPRLMKGEEVYVYATYMGIEEYNNEMIPWISVYKLKTK